MNILIYGAGGIGGFFGAKLAQTPHKITVIARGEHLKAIQNNGIIIKSITGDFTARPYLATNDLTKIDTPELVIFCVKSWQLKECAKKLLPFCNSHTTFLPLQNGADNVEKLSAIIPKKQILGGLCRMISYIQKPGVIANPYIKPTLLFGELTNESTARTEKILKVFSQAKINASVPKNIDIAIWKKFLFITTVSAIGGLTRVSIGSMRSNVYIKNLMKQTAQEIMMVAQAKGIHLPEDTIAKTFQAIAEQDASTTASTQRDIMEGKPSELEDFNGYIVKEGARLNIATPVNTMIYELLVPQERAARKALN